MILAFETVAEAGQDNVTEQRRLAIDHYIAACIRAETQPRVGEIATDLGISRVGLNQWFAREYGSSVSTYLKKSQIEEAKRLLSDTLLSTTRIAYISAFGTRRAFYRAFKRTTGYTPNEYRRLRLSK
jgi:AraC-like DNA-binding protein